MDRDTKMDRDMDLMPMTAGASEPSEMWHVRDIAHNRDVPTVRGTGGSLDYARVVRSEVRMVTVCANVPVNSGVAKIGFSNITLGFSQVPVSPPAGAEHVVVGSGIGAGLAPQGLYEYEARTFDKQGRRLGTYPFLLEIA